MKKLFFLLVAFSLFRTSPAVAVNASYFKTGNELLNECKEFLKLEDKTDMAAGNCIGFIEGATDIHNTLVDSLYIKPIYCFPQNVQSGQLVRVVLKYLVEYPELLNAPASHLVLNSFKEAFPCPESQPSK
jgi:hypothetical protein